MFRCTFDCLGFGFDSKTDDYKVVRFLTNHIGEYEEEGLATGNSDYLILSFDMASEKFSTLPLPKFCVSLAQCCLQLLDFNGLLDAIVYPREGTEKSFDLWVMNGSWIRQFSIESVPGVERPLGFWQNGS
ncbi:hypothetical protein DITRI_Ditri14bG0038700 [Diplodiscus trichospermus]